MVSSVAVADFAGNARFEIERRLGAGGMGVVYLAHDRARGERVALKTLAKVNAAAIYRFKQEFRALANVNHPNLVTLHELVSQGDQWFFTMELVDGVGFLEWVRPDGVESDKEVITALCTVPSADGDAGKHDVIAEPMSVPTVPRPGGAKPAELLLRPHGRERPRGISSPLHVERLRDSLRQLAAGVQALHDAGKLHRDVKPSNVLVTPEGRVVLLDFGLVLDLSRSAIGEIPDGGLVGTAAYMSPEQGSGDPLGPASDWYSVGVMLYQALTGRLPFYGENEELLAKKRKQVPPAPKVLFPRLPEDLNSLAVDLLRIRPEARPSGEEIRRRLQSEDTLSASSPGEETSTSGVSWSVPAIPSERVFFGRERHFAKLTSAFTDLSAGRPITVFVSGKSGLGKSAVVRRFLDALGHGEKAVVLEGRCFERESVPFKALDSLVDDLSQHLRSLTRREVERLLPAGMSALARVFPVLRRVEPVAEMIRREREVPDRHELRLRAFAALRDLLTNIARKKSLVLHIDDLQWGDVDSANVLRELLRPPDAPPLLLVAVYQSEHAEEVPALERLLRETDVAGQTPIDVRHVTIGPLTPYEARDLALAQFGREDPAARAHAEAIAIESGGSPLFVQELVRFVLALSEGKLDENTPSMLGMTLEQALTLRLVALPPEALAVLQVAAVAGGPVDLGVVASAANLSTADLRNALTPLKAGHLARTVPIGDRETIETAHERVRKTVLDDLEPDKLAAHHRALALALEESGSADPEALAVHFAGAGDRARAGEWAAQAATQAVETLAFDRAVRLYRLAIESLDPSEPSLRGIRRALAEALAAAGRGAEAAREYLVAADDATGGEALELRRHAAEQFLRSGRRDEGTDVLNEVLDAVDMKLPKNTAETLFSLVSHRARLKLRGYRCELKDVDRIPPKDLMRIDVAWTAVIGLGIIDPFRAAEFQSRHLLLALKAGEPTRLARAFAAEATYAAAGGTRSVDRTESLVGEIERLAKGSDDPYTQGMAGIIGGVAAYLRGDFPKTTELCEKGEAILRERCTKVAWDIASAQLFSLGALAYSGELRVLAQRVPVLVKEAEERGDLYAATVLRSGARNLAWLVPGDIEEARRQNREAEASWSKRGFLLAHYFVMLGDSNIDLYAGDPAAALTRVEAVWPAFERSMLRRVQFVRIEAEFLRGRAALGTAMTAESRERLLLATERSAKRLEKERAEWADPFAHLLRAGVAIARGDTESAVDLLTSAAVGFDAGHMKLYANVARRRLGEVTGGEEGRLRMEAADAWMRSHGVREPSRLGAMIAPFR